MSKFYMTPLPEQVGLSQTVRIDSSKKFINADISVITFTDKDTGQIVHYIPALDVSAYGETEIKATEMLQVVAEEMLRRLLTLSHKSLLAELRELGFKQTPLKNKEFSKAFLDINGDLQNLNAAENSVKRTNLSLAA